MFFEEKNNTLLNIVPNENIIEQKNVIKLMLFTNNYNKYDMNYIKKTYKLNTFESFRMFFKTNFKKKLIFNSEKSERMFINFVNFDMNYFNQEYGDKIHQTLFNFFIYGKKFYFNLCDQNFKNNSSKHHLKDCKCKVVVKSISNLKINMFLDILNGKVNISKPTKTIKIKNNNINKDILSCFNNIKNIEKTMGLQNDINYILESCTEQQSDNLNLFNDFVNFNQKKIINKNNKNNKNNNIIKSSTSNYKNNNNNNNNQNNNNNNINKILHRMDILEKTINNNNTNKNTNNNTNTNNIIKSDDDIRTTEIDKLYSKELEKKKKLEKLNELQSSNTEKKKVIVDMFKSDSSLKSLFNKNLQYSTSNEDNESDDDESNESDDNDESNESDDNDESENELNESNDESDDESDDESEDESNESEDDDNIDTEDEENMTGLYNIEHTENEFIDDKKNTNTNTNINFDEDSSEIDDISSVIKDIKDTKNQNEEYDLINELSIKIRKNNLTDENKDNLIEFCDKIKTNIGNNKDFENIYNKIKNYNCINSSMQDTEDYDRYYDLIKKVNELKNDFYLKSKF